MSGPARDVGNPGIADVNMLDARHLVVTGKSYGVTNLVVTGPSGRTILNRQIVVGAPAAGQVTMHRGVDVAQYACAPVASAHCPLIRPPRRPRRKLGLDRWEAPRGAAARRGLDNETPRSCTKRTVPRHR